MKKIEIIRKSNLNGWMEKLRLIWETKIAYHIQKQIHKNKISRDIGSFWKARKGKLGKVRDYTNSIKESKNFFNKYFSNNKRQKSSIGPLHEEGEIIKIDIEIV